MKSLLLIAFHFPPYSGGSGVHRAARFFQYLPENGWSPYVLTTGTLAYENVHQREQQEESSADTRERVIRAFAVDARRHLSIKGRYLVWLGIPDRWANWVLTAVPRGLAALYRRRISLIVVTFPIATAVLIGLILHRLTGKPLVVDFRDSMTEDNYPHDPWMRSIHRRIEKAVMKRGSLFVFTADSARRMYLNRYPTVEPGKCVIISNGYDEEDFAGIDCPPMDRRHDRNARPIRLVHAGILYPEERDPRAFFRALSRLKSEGTVSSKSLRIELRASGSEDYHAGLIRTLGIDDIVQLSPALPHKKALEDLAAADGLLIFQAANCNHQIPAKAYEYLRLGRPILALTAAEGDTAALLNSVGGATITDLADESGIYEELPRFVSAVRNGQHPLPEARKVRGYSRRGQSAALAECLNQVLSRVTGTEAPPSPY
jgi:glycosyltransferase involved in cell wall biosynthesis